MSFGDWRLAGIAELRSKRYDEAVSVSRVQTTMEITLKPEDEQIIQRHLESGVFSDVNEVIHRALESLDAEEVWLQANKGAVHERIARGLAQLDRGEGVSAEHSRAQLQERKATWLERR